MCEKEAASTAIEGRPANDKSMFTIEVFALIVDENNRILLCHRTDADLWNLPGGGLGKGETPWQGVKREVKEETGLDVEVIKLQGIYSKAYQDDIVFTFVCKIAGVNLTLSNEADDISYFSIGELPENTIQRHVERIIDFFMNSDGIVIKGYFTPGSEGLEFNKC